MDGVASCYFKIFQQGVIESLKQTQFAAKEKGIRYKNEQIIKKEAKFIRHNNVPINIPSKVEVSLSDESVVVQWT